MVNATRGPASFCEFIHKARRTQFGRPPAAVARAGVACIPRAATLTSSRVAVRLPACRSFAPTIMRIITTARRAGARRACTGRRELTPGGADRLAARPHGRAFFSPYARPSPLTAAWPLMLRIALPNKGRLADEARELFTDAGLEIRAAGPRALTASLGGEFQALFVRAQDIPEFVADGAADAGVTGRRSRARVRSGARGAGGSHVRTLPPRRRRHRGERALARSTTCARARAWPRSSRASRRSSSRRVGRRVEIVPVSGAAEIAPHIGIADVIVDLVSTGSTLRVNGLREIATVLESSARLIAAPDARSDAARGRALDELVARCAASSPRATSAT